MQSLYLGNPEEKRVTPFKNAEKRFGEIFRIRFESNWDNAIEIIKKTKIEMVIIDIDDIEKKYKDIEEFKKKASRKKERIVFIGITKNKSNAFEALQLKFDTVILAPLDQKEIDSLINNFDKKFPEHVIKITTMPNLCIYVDNEVVKFKNKKAMEMLAILIDQEGVPITNSMLIDKLWPNSCIDEKAKSRCRVTWHNLKTTLSQYGVEYILKSGNRNRYIDKDKFVCDLYELFAGNEQYTKIYGEKYLEDYDWAEETKGRIASFLAQNDQYYPIDPE